MLLSAKCCLSANKQGLLGSPLLLTTLVQPQTALAMKLPARFGNVAATQQQDSKPAAGITYSTLRMVKCRNTQQGQTLPKNEPSDHQNWHPPKCVRLVSLCDGVASGYRTSAAAAGHKLSLYDTLAVTAVMLLTCLLLDLVAQPLCLDPGSQLITIGQELAAAVTQVREVQALPGPLKSCL